MMKFEKALDLLLIMLLEIAVATVTACVLSIVFY